MKPQASSRLVAALDRLAPRPFDPQSEEARAARVVLGIMAVGVVAVVAIGSSRWIAQGLDAGTIAALVGGVMVIVAWVSWRVSGSRTLAADLRVLTALVGVAATCTAEGGLISPSAPWFCVIPLLGSAVGSRLSLAQVSTLVLLAMVGISLRSDGDRSVVRLVSLGMATAFVAGTTGLMDDARRRALAQRERLDAVKDQWVSVVSHELRTPLTAIIGALGLVKARVAGELPERVSRFIDIAEENSFRLGRLVNDVLDMERINQDSLRMRTEPVAIAELAARAVETYQPMATESGGSLRLTTTGSGTIDADPDRLMQVLANLVSNAIDFSPAGGEVEIDVDSGPAGVRVSVTDSGPGIAEAFKPKVFEPFEQEDGGTQRKHGGTGLGLAISRAIIERHRGQLDFESRAGEGARFWFAIPR